MSVFRRFFYLLSDISYMISIQAYPPEEAARWNHFNQQAKNGLFLFHRDFMEYHADRFQDASLMVYEKDKLVALLPANQKEKHFDSHGGLTFGGFIFHQKMKSSTVLDIFSATLDYLAKAGFQSWRYKTIPHIYQQYPAEEDRYALWRQGARLSCRNLSASLCPKDHPPYSKGRKWSVKKGKKEGLEIRYNQGLAEFMALEQELLQDKYDAAPVHTAAELALLQKHFPKNIQLHTVHDEQGTLLAGCVIFAYKQVAHAQYIAATTEGRERFALDYLFDYLIHDFYQDKAYFDFGTSNEEQGRVLNEPLIQSKESYGGRGVAVDIYEFSL